MRKFLIVLLLTSAAAAQVNTAVSPVPRFQFIGSNGVPLAGACLFSYVTGTSTPLATYSDSTGLTTNPNPVVLDASGSANVWLGPQKYRPQLFTSGGINCVSGAQVWQIDGIAGNNIIGATTISLTAQTAPSCVATQYILWADSSATRWKFCNNGVIDTIVGQATTDTLTNKTLTSPTVNSGTLNASTVTGATTVSGTTTFSGATTFSAPSTFTGSLTASAAALVNGVYDAAACSLASPPSWCSGSDLGAWVNAAATTCAGTCIIQIPAGTYTPTTTMTLNKPGLSLVGAGSAATILNYAGSSDVIRVQMNPFTITQAGRIEGLTINCSGCSSPANGLHEGDVVGFRMIDLHISGFTGASSSCLWTDNVLGWTERGTEQSVHLDGCTKAHRWTNTTNTQVTSSFGHWPLIEERWNLNGRQTGWSVEGGLIYDHGLDSITGNAAGGSANTFFAVSGVQFSAGPATSVAAGHWNEQMEQTSGTASNIWNLAASTTFAGCGEFALAGFVFGTLTGTLSVNGTACPLNNGNSFSVLTSGGASDPVIGLNTSNQTVISGDGTVKTILLQPNPGTTAATVGATALTLGSSVDLKLTQSGSPRILCSDTNPSISSGFNVGSVGAGSNGTCSFFVTVGIGTAGSTGVLTMPAASNGWNCFAFNITHGGAIILETATGTTSATLTNYGTTPGTPVNWTNSDIIGISCFGH